MKTITTPTSFPNLKILRITKFIKFIKFIKSIKIPTSPNLLVSMHQKPLGLQPVQWSNLWSQSPSSQHNLMPHRSTNDLTPKPSDFAGQVHFVASFPKLSHVEPTVHETLNHLRELIQLARHCNQGNTLVFGNQL